ncbi:hypothetical protein CBL_20634, partial [Carabus blaptoides fortunei]
IQEETGMKTDEPVFGPSTSDISPVSGPGTRDMYPVPGPSTRDMSPVLELNAQGILPILGLGTAQMMATPKNRDWRCRTGRVDNKKRILWPMGKISELITGKDGVARVAKLQTKSGI